MVTTDNLAIVQNGHGFSNHNFLDVVTSSAPDALTSSVESIYEDALSGEGEPVVHEAGQLALGAGHPESYESGAGSPFVDPTGNVPAPAADAVYPADNGTAPVEQPVYIAVPNAVLDAPFAEPEDVEENVVFDPLEASPLLATLGFHRVQQAYERWLVNMSHAVSLYQGTLSQIYMLIQIYLPGFRATVVYYEWPMGDLDRVGRRFVRILRQTMTAYQQVRASPYCDVSWNVLRVSICCYQIYYLSSSF